MATPISIQQLVDAGVDADSLEVLVNGDENTNVSTRLGEIYPSAKKAMYTLFANGGLPAQPFTTKALMLDSSLIDGSYAQVVNDDVNNGLYLKTSGVWSKTDYDPVSQSESYVNPAIFQLLDISNFISGSFIYIDGTALNSNDFSATGYIKINASTSYDIYTEIAGNARNAWYDKDKVFISAFGENQNGLISTTSPPNSYYLRVSYQNISTKTPFVKTSSFNYDIKKVVSIVEQHASNINSTQVFDEGVDLNTVLTSIEAQQNVISAKQNKIIGQMDLMDDKENPYFINTSEFVKAVNTPTSFSVVDVSSRTSDNVMVVSNSNAFVLNGSCVIYDSTANKYTSHNVIKIDGNSITVVPNLPTNPSKAQTMHDVALGQHLGLYGYKGLADFMLEQTQRYSYKKDGSLIFGYNPPNYPAASVWNNANITSDGTTTAIPVKLIGTAGNGGFVTGTTNLTKGCLHVTNLNIGIGANTQYLSASYSFKDAVVGNGYELSFNAQDSNGFIEIPLAVRNDAYTSSVDSSQQTTSGKARLQVLNGTTLIHNAVYNAGQVHHVFVDFTATKTITVRVLCEENKPTSTFLSGVFGYSKSDTTSTDVIFSDGDVVAFLGDSWTQYPVAADIGETGQIRPDGSVSDGSQWLSRRMREKLLLQGKDVTMLNMGFGGQTSRWGKYWVNTIIALNPKPTHCVVCFYINDSNSIGNPSNTFYDFDPNDMFVNKPESSGGINGRTASYDEWLDNIEFICDRLIASGIKPIVMMPSQTASVSQAQVIRASQLNKVATGF